MNTHLEVRHCVLKNATGYCPKTPNILTNRNLWLIIWSFYPHSRMGLLYKIDTVDLVVNLHTLLWEEYEEMNTHGRSIKWQNHSFIYMFMDHHSCPADILGPSGTGWAKLRKLFNEYVLWPRNYITASTNRYLN